MVISERTPVHANKDLFRDVPCTKATLGLLLVMKACFIFAYIMNHKIEIVHTSRNLMLKLNSSLPPVINIPEFCNGVETSKKYRMTSRKFSRATSEFDPKHGSIVVHIRAYNNRNIPKLNGGDMIFVWANQVFGDGIVPGNVIDHRNGSYTGFIRVFWTGRTDVYVKQVSVVENTCLRYKALNKYGDIVFTLSKPYGLRAVYFSNKTEVMTPCNTNNFIYGSTHTCDFTNLNGEMSWYCGLPDGGEFQCEDLRSFSLGSFESRASSGDDKIRYPGHGMFRTQLYVVATNRSTTNSAILCNERSPLESWMETSPSGYFIKGNWVPTNCKANLKHTVGNYRTCLQNKTLYFLGDSTVRQYVNFFIKNILKLGTKIESDSTFESNFKSYHGLNTFTNYGITIIYRKQAMPLHFSGHEIPINNIKSFPQIIDKISESGIPDTSLVLLLNYQTHFTSYPPEKYRERLQHLVISLHRLFISKPSAKVFFKGPAPCISNTKWWDPYISLVYKTIIEEEFYDIKDRVTYLNVWDISVAHNVENVHPYGTALLSQLQQFMSLLC